MQNKIQKLYCYVDETGQDTGGELFLVSVILKGKEQLDELRKKLEAAEKHSRKNSVKWFRAPFAVREAYLLELLKIKELRGAVYYSCYHNTTDFTPLISLTIAKSILSQNLSDYSATIIIDASNETETERVRQELKSLSIHYKKIRGMRDEQDAVLRLADSMAGLLRDYIEAQEYAGKFMRQFLAEKMVKEI